MFRRKKDAEELSCGFEDKQKSPGDNSSSQHRDFTILYLLWLRNAWAAFRHREDHDHHRQNLRDAYFRELLYFRRYSGDR